MLMCSLDGEPLWKARVLVSRTVSESLAVSGAFLGLRIRSMSVGRRQMTLQGAAVDLII